MADNSSEDDMTSVIDFTINDCKEQHSSKAKAHQSSREERPINECWIIM